ncbi:MAG: hypothetical protein RLZZ157_79 [Pseudomonadota bacterium]|jgi:hypothetical protein
MAKKPTDMAHDVLAALRASERFAYGRATLGEALLAWKPWSQGPKLRDLRFTHGVLVVEVMALCNSCAMIRAYQGWSQGKKATEMDDLRAVMKAALALIFGRVGGAGALEADAPAQVLDFKRMAAGDRDE